MADQKQSQPDGSIPAYNPTEYHQYGTNEALPAQQQTAPSTTTTATATGDEKHPVNYPPPPSQPPTHTESTSYPPPPAGPPPTSTHYPYHAEGVEHKQQSTTYPPPTPPAQQQGYFPPAQNAGYQPSQAQGQQPTPTFAPPPGQEQNYPPPPATQPPAQSQQLQVGGLYPPPPQRLEHKYSEGDLSNPIHYTRDPHKLIAYLVPFPTPKLERFDTSQLPTRFLIYTPPPPPLQKPAEGEKEARLHKIQRKWQEEVKSAKTSTAKTRSWKGLKAAATKGISAAMDYTKTADLEFLNRVPGSDGSKPDKHAQDGVEEGDETHKTVELEEMVLIYPNTLNHSPEEMKIEFVNSMMRSKTKAQKDAVIATGLLPVTAAVDLLATVIWPFGGLLEIDSVWAYSSIRGAKISRSVTKRLASTGHAADAEQNTLHLNFVPAARIEILRKYLASECHKYDARLFPSSGPSPTETDVLAAIGWTPSQSGGETRNWEDEQWETSEVKDDVKAMMHKGAREWTKWCKEFAKAPEKALKK